MNERPSGIVTFLFTDIEGSTQLWEHRPEWMARAHARQETLLREAFRAHRGYPYKMIGDAFQVAFASARDAVAAAVAAQRALGREPWGEAEIRVRMGLHSGATEERGDDYVGPLLNRAARLMSAGHGGQILVSQATRDLLGEALPEHVGLRDLGERRLKDLIRKERVYQVVSDDLASEFPALRTLDARPHNLPVQPTHLIGREPELAEVARLVAGQRLVTLIGAGGSGKTRLALHVAAELLDTFADGVWFVDLAPVSEASTVPQAVASTIGATAEPGTPVLDGLVRHLGERQTLLVLDNCEHLLDATAALVRRLLERSTRLRILATSREPLRSSGESTYRVPSLATPDPVTTELAALDRFPAVRLFVERAAHASPSFALTTANAGAVAAICRRLDGIPLAIELAAVRVRALTVGQIAERLSDRFRLLTGGDRTALPRQQTLRGLIDWSHELLAERERTLLRRIAVFAGSFSLDAAEQVGAGDGRDGGRADVLADLTELVEKSMVMADPETGRYRLLETVREYALERLCESGDERATRERHLDAYLDLAERADPGLKGPEDAVWAARLDADLENLLAAHAWCASEPRYAERGLRLAVALRNYWIHRDLVEQGHRVIVEALARSGADPGTALRGRVLIVAARFATLLGHFEEARAFASESRSIGRATGDHEGETAAEFELGLLAENQGDHDGARPHFTAALRLARAVGHGRLAAMALVSLAALARAAGEWDAAEGLFREALALNRGLGDRNNTALCLLGLAAVSIGAGHLADARATVAEALALADETGSRPAGRTALELCAALAAAAGHAERAARLNGAALAILERTGQHRTPSDDAFFDPLLARTREALGDAAYQSASAAGQTASYEEALDEARAWLASDPLGA